MLRAVNLKTEYLTDPLGIDVTRPRFFWTLEGSGKRQSAWRIRARTDKGIRCWDSGKVFGSSFTHIVYEGRPLVSRDRVTWQVKVWDENDYESEWSQEAVFELGLLDKGDWDAWWITAGKTEGRRRNRNAVDCFLREFRLTAVPAKARLYITACGLYEVRLNGARITTDALTPGWTDARARVFYQTYDVLSALKPGTNKLELWVGKGWFASGQGVSGRKRRLYTQPRVLAQLEMVDQLGERMILGTDKSFHWSCDGPIENNDLFRGETVRCGREPSYSGDAELSSWMVQPECANTPAICDRERRKPVLLTTPSGKKVLDFGAYAIAQLECDLRGEEGSTVTLRMGDALNEKGELLADGARHHRRGGCEIRLRVSGWEEHYRETFSCAGFRYVQVEGLKEIEPEKFTAIQIASDIRTTGSFSSDNEKLNEIFRGAQRTLEACFLDAPVFFRAARQLIAPAGDALAVAGASLMLTDAATFWEKWLWDLKDGQKKNGAFPAAAPTGTDRWPKHFAGAAGWSDAGVLLPYLLWKELGDKAILTRFYPFMRKYAYFLIHRAYRTPLKRRLKKHLLERYIIDVGHHFGEGLEPEEECPEKGLRALGRHPEEATAYFAAVMVCMEDVARTLGKEKDRNTFAEFALGAKKAYIREFLPTRKTDKASQAKLLRPVALEIIDGKTAERLFYALVRSVREHKHHSATGLLSTGMLLEVLAERGFGEDAYRLLLNPTEPGWLSQLRDGDGVFRGTWSGTDVEGRIHGARCRLAFASAGGWLMRWCGGVRLEGENRFAIAPFPGGGVKRASVQWDTIYGRIESEWSVKPGGWVVELNIPAGTTARVCLPDGTEQTFDAGRHLLGV